MWILNLFRLIGVLFLLWLVMHILIQYALPMIAASLLIMLFTAALGCAK